MTDRLNGTATAARKPVVVVLNLYPPAVRAIIATSAPPEIDLRLATTSEPDAIRTLVADADVFVGGSWPITAAVMDCAPRLKLIHKWGVGVEKIDLDAARARGIQVAITAGANAQAVAELALLLMLMVLRRIPEAQADLRAGRWSEGQAVARSQARQLRGKRVGLVGLGNVGREVAIRVRAFGAQVAYFDIRRATPREERALGLIYQPLDDLLVSADVVSLHTPYVVATRGLLSRARIASLKPGAIVINTARGELVDEAALADALRSGRVGGAGLDVLTGEPPAPDNPLLAMDLPNVVATPHIGGSVFDLVADIAAHVFYKHSAVFRW